MKAPDKIYVPQYNIEVGNIQELSELIVVDSAEYIRKDALLKLLELEPYTSFPDDFTKGCEHGRNTLREELIAEINSM